MEKLLYNPIFMIALCSLLGHFAGKLGYKHLKFGSSATLFVALLISYFLRSNGIELDNVPRVIFIISLIGFIVSVGLIASQSIKDIIKKYGFRFIVLALVVTATGALVTFSMLLLFFDYKYEIIGTYVGALTSSPGLATALELAKNLSSNPSAKVGIGYAIAYIPGIVIVIGFVQLMSKRKYPNNPPKTTTSSKTTTHPFNIANFTIVILIGILLGSITLNISPSISISLGMAGGTLISALFFGSTIKGFTFNQETLSTIRDLSLNTFLSIVGLNYGYKAINSIQIAGFQFLLIGITTALSSIIMGYIIGKYILKIETGILVGGICGGMTSTPGLAAAIDSFGGDDVVAGYGATYPFALIAMIIFTNLIF